MYDRIYPSMSVFSEFAEFWNARVRRNYNHPILKDLWSKKVEKIFIGVDDKMEVIKIANDEFRLPIAMEDYMSRLKYVEFFFSGDGISAMVRKQLYVNVCVCFLIRCFVKVLHRASARAWLAWSEEMQNTNDWAGANDEFEECMKTNIELLSQKHYLSLSIDTVKDIVYQLLAYDGCIEVDYSQE